MLPNRSLEGGWAALGSLVGWLGDALEGLGAPWGVLGAPWAWFRASWNRFGTVRAPSWEGLWGVFGRPGASWYLIGASATRFSFQTEALRMGCHLVLDVYSLLLGFVECEHVKRSSGVTKI